MKKVSISTFQLQERYGDREAIRIAKEIGADAIDFNTDSPLFDYRNPSSVYSKKESEFVAYFSQLKQYADTLGLEIGQTHGRVTGFKNIPDEDDAFLKNARLDFMAAGILCAPTVVIHNVGTLFMGKDAKPDLIRDLNYAMFTKLLPMAKEHHVKIAAETFGSIRQFGCVDFFGQMEEFVRAYDRICDTTGYGDDFTVCVDTGHSNLASHYGEPSPGDVIRRLSKRITLLHLHDNDTLTDQHKIPMTGSIDWEDVFSALDEIGYSGNYNVEAVLTHFGKNFLTEEAAFAVKVMRNLLKERYGE